MHKLKQILRLHFEGGLSQHQIALSLQLSAGVVNKYLKQAHKVQLTWPLPSHVQEEDLRHILKGQVGLLGEEGRTVVDFAMIHQELKGKGVTRQLVWEEYQAKEGRQSYSYAQFCRLYRQWLRKQTPSMRQVHKAGDKLFVDYCGPTVAIIDSDTGEVREAQIFVATLGASNYTFAEATWDQKLPNFIASHVRAFEFFGGVPAILVPDNLKSAVSKACRFEPELNSSYADCAAFYGTAILPARPYKPKDKAKVENAVLVVQRWILARLRRQTFFGLAELNAAVARLLVDLNERPFKKLPGSRKSLFETIDKPALKPLPARPYTFAAFKKARVNNDYHVEFDGHYYSVPYALIKEEIELRITTTTIECFYAEKRVAVHTRSYIKGTSSSRIEHMPKAHQKYTDWSVERLLNRAQEIGPSTYELINNILKNNPPPELRYGTCVGIIRLAKQYSEERLESACKRSLEIGVTTKKSVASILAKSLDKQPSYKENTSKINTPIKHDNIRGSEYYEKYAQ